ncbi:MAG: transglutaminase domain-containing protein [Chitinophagaceae bacterium]|nr:transglutaminase domain-containing protein [Chitinophagaceae bacterium]
MEKARKIFEYVRDNFTCTNYNRRTMDQTLRNIVKTRNGSVAEINLLLTAMLKFADIDADPVMLSTRSNGYTFSYHLHHHQQVQLCDQQSRY